MRHYLSICSRVFTWKSFAFDIQHLLLFDLINVNFFFQTFFRKYKVLCCKQPEIVWIHKLFHIWYFSLFSNSEQSNHIASEVKSIKSRFEKVTILKLMNEPINLRWNQNVLEFEGLRKWICWTFLSSLNVIEIPKKP